MIRSVRQWIEYKRKLSQAGKAANGPLREFDKDAFKEKMLAFRVSDPPRREYKIRWT